MRLKYKLGLGIIVVALVICFMTYQSYALWIVNHTGKENVVEVGCFTINYEEISSPITLNNTYPVSDTKGLSTIPYTFKVKNNCSIDSSYVVTLNTLTTNTISKENIKFAIYKEGETKPTSGINLQEHSETHQNTDLKELNVKDLEESIILREGALKQNEEATYNVHLWLDETTGNEAMGQRFESSIDIISRATSIAPKTAIDKITELAATSSEIVDDGTSDHNLRYIGSNPNNYVSFNGETWRIIGVMNNMKTNESDPGESRIKIIRSEAIGEDAYAWDTYIMEDDSDRINWAQADLMKLLNPGYESESVGGSLYWNSTEGYCPQGTENETYPCQFLTSGLKEDSKPFIAETIWNIGGTDGGFYTDSTVSMFYEMERGTTVWTEEASNPSIWKGYVGLLYPSDYGYATSGGATTSRDTCLQKPLMSWYEWSECGVYDENNSTNNWLSSDVASSQWFLTADVSELKAYSLQIAGGYLELGNTYEPMLVYPTLYLKSSVQIVDGNGSIDNPYVLSL